MRKMKKMLTEKKLNLAIIGATKEPITIRGEKESGFRIICENLFFQPPVLLRVASQTVLLFVDRTIHIPPKKHRLKLSIEESDMVIELGLFGENGEAKDFRRARVKRDLEGRMTFYADTQKEWEKKNGIEVWVKRRNILLIRGQSIMV